MFRPQRLILFLLFYLLQSVLADYSPCNGRSKLNESCDLTEDCDNKGSICLRSKCRCHPHYIEVHDEKLRTTTCQILPSKIDAPCDRKCREPLFCRSGRCQCVTRGTTRISNGECVTSSRVGDRCSHHYDCTSPFSACLNSQCVCISGTIQQGPRCIAAANCPLGGLPGQACVRKVELGTVLNLPSARDQSDCPPGQACVTAGDSPIGHCCPVVCPLSSHVDTQYSCDPNATAPIRCPSDSHFCHLLSDGGFSQAVCCRRPCNAIAPNALYANNACIARGQLNAQCTSNAQCGGGEGMECVKGQCQCLEGFRPNIDALTNPMKNPSQTCTRNCQSDALSRDTSCMKPSTLGGQCFIQKQCPDNAGCYRGRCACRCGYLVNKDNNKCIPMPTPPPTTARPQLPNIIPPNLGGGDLLNQILSIFNPGGK